MSPKMTDDETDNFTSCASSDLVIQALFSLAPCNQRECTFVRKNMASFLYFRCVVVIQFMWMLVMHGRI